MMNSIFRKYLILVALIGSQISLQAQNIIHGVVNDSLGKPIPYALVILKSADGIEIINSASTNTEGYYTIDPVLAGDYLLLSSRLGYADQQRAISIVPSASRYHFNFIMRSQSFKLDEFVIESTHIKFKKNKDTLIINPEAYADGTEIVVEDLLKKIPGIEVSEGGNISVKGKSVETVMIDGDNLFEQGYSILTKNLRSGYIDKVQVLNHFSENEILKGVEDSDKVALNLTIKKDKRLPLTGDMKLGLSPELSRYDHQLNLISIKKYTKHFAFSNTSNIGKDPTGNIANLLYNNRSLPGEDVSTQPFVSIVREQAPLSDERANLNRPSFFSLNSLYKPIKDLKIKSLVFGKLDEIHFNNSTLREYFSEFSNIALRNDYRAIEQTQNITSKIDAEFKFSEQSKIELQGKQVFNSSRIRADKLFNKINLEERLQSIQQHTDINFIYSKRIKKNKALQLKGRYLNGQQPQLYRINGFPPGLIVNRPLSSDSLLQNSRNLNSFIGLELQYIIDHKGFNHNFNLGSNLQKDKIQSHLQFVDNGQNLPYSAFSNNQIYEVTDQFLRYRTRYQKGKISFAFATILRHAEYQLERETLVQEYSLLTIRPAAEIKYEPNDAHLIEILYSFQNRDASSFDLLPNYMMTNLHTISRGGPNSFQFSGHTLIGKYTFGNWGTKTQGNATIFFNHDPMYLGNYFIIQPNYMYWDKILLKNRNQYNLKAELDRYVPKFKLNLKAQFNYNRSHFQNQINGDDLVDISQINRTYSLESRSAFKGFFNFHIGTTITESVIQNREKVKLYNKLHFLDLDFRLSSALMIQIRNELFEPPNTMDRAHLFHFADADIRYKSKNKKYEFSLRARNLFNLNSYENNFVTPTSRNMQQFEIINRYLLFTVNLRL